MQHDAVMDLRRPDEPPLKRALDEASAYHRQTGEMKRKGDQ